MTKAKKTPPPKEQEIITAAAQLFKEKGYRATTLEDIAAAVGMLKGSLYYYIRSKEGDNQNRPGHCQPYDTFPPTLSAYRSVFARLPQSETEVAR
jgi:AcrR family transcriptional regulator